MTLGSICLSLLAFCSPSSFSWLSTLKKLLSVMFLGRFSSPSATEWLDLRAGDPSTTLKELIALCAVAGIVTGDLLLSITGTSRPFSYLSGDLTWTAFLGDGRLSTNRTIRLLIWLLTLFGIKRHFGGAKVGSLVQSRFDISWLSTTWTSYLTGALIINEIHSDNSTLPTFLANLFLANPHVAHRELVVTLFSN